jgi:UDP-N-acetylmuramate dehydrogenase
MVIGGGYNILATDSGFRGVVVSLKRIKSVTRLPGNRIRVQAGISNQRLVKFLEMEGLSGLEFLCGIPGTVGGALAMNAGCHGFEIMEFLESLTLVTADGLNEVAAAEIEYGYRFLKIPDSAAIVDACFRLAADDPTAIAVRVNDYLEKRRTSQKVSYPNAGSFFKNPAGAQAWRLIDAAALRGVSVGGAQVSEQHANFLVNRGGATADDFLKLVEIVKARVLAISGTELEEEVRIFGEE